MPTLVAFTLGLVVWIVVWAIGVKPFDAFLLVFVFVLPAAAWQIYGPATDPYVLQASYQFSLNDTAIGLLGPGSG